MLTLSKYKYYNWLTCSQHRTLQNIWIPILQIFVFVYWRGTRKHFHWSKKYFRPIRMFSCPPSINKNKDWRIGIGIFWRFRCRKQVIFYLIHGSFLIWGRRTHFFWCQEKKVSSRRLMSQSINPFFVDVLQIVFSRLVTRVVCKDKAGQPKIQQTKMLVTCQRFCDLFLFGLVWHTLGDFRNISTISIFLLAVAPYNFYNFDTKMV